jgi:hypothetical protein
MVCEAVLASATHADVAQTGSENTLTRLFPSNERHRICG